MIRLDLQLFADGEDEEFEIDPDTDAEGDDLLAKIAGYNESVGVESETETDDEPETEEEVEEEAVEDEAETSPVQEEEAKPVQSKEENAKFAEMRREQQAREKLEQTPEFQLAKELAGLYGTTPDQMLAQIKQQRMQQEAERTGVPLEYLQQQQQLQQQIQQMQEHQQKLEFQNWQHRISQETTTIKSAYPFLTDDQIVEATQYMLETLGNPNLPLEQAVLAKHGKLITENLRKAAEQEALAKVSGRKKAPPAPTGQGKDKSPASQLSEEERYVAKQMGMSPDEYAKYKNMR